MRLRNEHHTEMVDRHRCSEGREQGDGIRNGNGNGDRSRNEKKHMSRSEKEKRVQKPAFTSSSGAMGIIRQL